MHWSDGWSWSAWIAMAVVMVSVWALLAWSLITLFRWPDRGGSVDESAESTLASRFAEGDIDADEYRSRLATLRTASRR